MRRHPRPVVSGTTSLNATKSGLSGRSSRAHAVRIFLFAFLALVAIILFTTTMRPSSSASASVNLETTRASDVKKSTRTNDMVPAGQQPHQQIADGSTTHGGAEEAQEGHLRTEPKIPSKTRSKNVMSTVFSSDHNVIPITNNKKDNHNPIQAEKSASSSSGKSFFLDLFGGQPTESNHHKNPQLKGGKANEEALKKWGEQEQGHIGGGGGAVGTVPADAAHSSELNDEKKTSLDSPTTSHEETVEEVTDELTTSEAVETSTVDKHRTRSLKGNAKTTQSEHTSASTPTANTVSPSSSPLATHRSAATTTRASPHETTEKHREDRSTTSDVTRPHHQQQIEGHVAALPHESNNNNSTASTNKTAPPPQPFSDFPIFVDPTDSVFQKPWREEIRGIAAFPITHAEDPVHIAVNETRYVRGYPFLRGIFLLVEDDGSKKYRVNPNADVLRARRARRSRGAVEDLPPRGTNETRSNNHNNSTNGSNSANAAVQVDSQRQERCICVDSEAHGDFMKQVGKNPPAQETRGHNGARPYPDWRALARTAGDDWPLRNNKLYSRELHRFHLAGHSPSNDAQNDAVNLDAHGPGLHLGVLPSPQRYFQSVEFGLCTTPSSSSSSSSISQKNEDEEFSERAVRYFYASNNLTALRAMAMRSLPPCSLLDFEIGSSTVKYQMRGEVAPPYLATLRRLAGLVSGDVGDQVELQSALRESADWVLRGAPPLDQRRNGQLDQLPERLMEMESRNHNKRSSDVDFCDFCGADEMYVPGNRPVSPFQQPRYKPIRINVEVLTELDAFVVNFLANHVKSRWSRVKHFFDDVGLPTLLSDHDAKLLQGDEKPPAHAPDSEGAVQYVQAKHSQAVLPSLVNESLGDVNVSDAVVLNVSGKDLLESQARTYLNRCDRQDRVTAIAQCIVDSRDVEVVEPQALRRQLQPSLWDLLVPSSLSSTSTTSNSTTASATTVPEDRSQSRASSTSSFAPAMPSRYHIHQLSYGGTIVCYAAGDMVCHTVGQSAGWESELVTAMLHAAEELRRLTRTAATILKLRHKEQEEARSESWNDTTTTTSNAATQEEKTDGNKTNSNETNSTSSHAPPVAAPPLSRSERLAAFQPMDYEFMPVTQKQHLESYNATMYRNHDVGFLDIGGNVGVFAAAMWNRRFRTYVFEALPQNYLLLRFAQCVNQDVETRTLQEVRSAIETRFRRELAATRSAATSTEAHSSAPPPPPLLETTTTTSAPVQTDVPEWMFPLPLRQHHDHRVTESTTLSSTRYANPSFFEATNATERGMITGRVPFDIFHVALGAPDPDARRAATPLQEGAQEAGHAGGAAVRECVMVSEQNNFGDVVVLCDNATLVAQARGILQRQQQQKGESTKSVRDPPPSSSSPYLFGAYVPRGIVSLRTLDDVLLGPAATANSNLPVSRSTANFVPNGGLLDARNVPMRRRFAQLFEQLGLDKGDEVDAPQRKGDGKESDEERKKRELLLEQKANAEDQDPLALGRKLLQQSSTTSTTALQEGETHPTTEPPHTVTVPNGIRTEDTIKVLARPLKHGQWNERLQHEQAKHFEHLEKLRERAKQPQRRSSPYERMVPRYQSGVVAASIPRAGSYEALDCESLISSKNTTAELLQFLSYTHFVMKMDVEGHEGCVVEGAHRLLANPVTKPKFIISEVWKSRNLTSYGESMIQEYGYEGISLGDRMHLVHAGDAKRYHQTMTREIDSIFWVAKGYGCIVPPSLWKAKISVDTWLARRR